MKKRPKTNRPKSLVSEIVTLIDRLVTQAGLTQFQISTINRRLDALEKTTAPPRRKAKP